MSLIRFAVFAVLALALFACATPPQNNRYELPPQPDSSAASAVSELQSKARQALSRQAWDEAVGYLQRALRIEPRNAYSWHYLAETYWRGGDLRRCAEMAERAASYVEAGDELEGRNQRLRDKCQG